MIRKILNDVKKMKLAQVFCFVMDGSRCQGNISDPFGEWKILIAFTACIPVESIGII